MGTTKATGETVKTTVDLPIRLWRAAKVRAMDERTDLRHVLIAALEAFLKTKKEDDEEGYEDYDDMEDEFEDGDDGSRPRRGKKDWE